MKKILLLIALSVCACTIKAQGISYQGEISIGYSLAAEDGATERIPLHIINGLRINDYLFVGIGTGVEYYCY